MPRQLAGWLYELQTMFKVYRLHEAQRRVSSLLQRFQWIQQNNIQELNPEKKLGKKFIDIVNFCMFICTKVHLKNRLATSISFVNDEAVHF